MSELLDLTLEIARAAGRVQRERFSEPRTIETKSSEIDLVTDVDHASERVILDRIARARPKDGTISEEDGERAGTSGLVWIVDPLDGTTNYAHGIPHFAVSIGIERDGERELGVIYDPIKEETFWAERGKGAFKNGEAIRVSDTSELRRALLATGFAYDVHSADVDNVDYFQAFIKRAQAVRRIGSAALDLAYLACGRFDGFWELNLHAWDVAAGYLIVSEAGGQLSDLTGGEAPRSGSEVVGSNGALHAQLLDVVARVRTARGAS